MITLMSYQVFARTLGIESQWVPETARLVNLYIVFLLLARLQIEDEHIKIDYFYQKAPESARKYIDNLIDMLVVFVALFAAYASLTYMFRFVHVRTPGAGIPTPLLYFPAVIGLSVYAFCHAQDLVARSPRLTSVVNRVRG